MRTIVEPRPPTATGVDAKRGQALQRIGLLVIAILASAVSIAISADVLAPVWSLIVPALCGAALLLVVQGRSGSPPIPQPSTAMAEAKPNPAAPVANDPIPGQQTLFECSPVGIVIVDRNGEVECANPAFLCLVANTETTADLTGRPIASVLKRADGDVWPEISQAAAAFEVTFGASDDQSGTLHLRPTGDGRAIIHLIDTSQQKTLELQFAQSQKMLAVGTLAGGIAHDFNNLLTAMIGFCDLLLLRHQPGDPSFADIMQIKQNSNRAANLVRQLLAFSRQQTLQPRIMNLADVIADLSNLLHRLLGAGIALEVEHGADVSPVRVDRVQLEQVLINLAVNSRDAMDGQGKLIIRSRDVLPDQVAQQLRDPPLPAGRWVLIQIQDTGAGIPKAHLTRIFEPFFTTKPVGEGTGLGLSTVYGIIKQTDGYIYAENLPAGGAMFSIYLPAHAAAATATDAAPQRADLTGNGSILLVEDEDPVRMFSARALRSKGYRVTEARTGQAAIALMDGEDEPFDLLITDVIMPEMDGPALIEHVRATQPNLRIICISGYAESTFRDKLNQFEDLHFLAKPFTLQQLAGKAKDAMTH
jgi:two-component system, cell cycle sensor histidine kinase and response regulator CckA